MLWPKYRNPSPHAVSIAQLKFFVSDTRSIKSTGFVLLLVVVYLLGVRLSLPFADVQQMQHLINRSVFLSAVNAFFTGGALGNLSPFTLGVLPLIFLYFSSASITGSRLRIQARLEWRSLAIIVILASLVTIWLAFSSAIPKTFLGFLGTTLSMILGVLALFWLENKIAEHGGPDIIYLNALLIGVSYTLTLLFTRNVGDLAMVFLIGLFILSFAFLVGRVDFIQVVNIRERETRLEGRLPIPATNSLLRQLLFILLLVFAFCIMALTNFFFGLSLNPFGNSVLETVLVVLAQVIVILLLRNGLIDDILGQFNCVATARRLKVGNWIIPNLKEGLPTAIYLRNRVAQAHRINYVFYLAWIVLLSAVETLSRLVKMPITPLPFGPLGFVIVLTLSSDVGYGVFLAFRNYIERVNFKEFWTTPRPAVQTFDLEAEPYGWEELLERILSTLPPDERKKLWHLTSGKARIRDLVPILIAMLRYLQAHRVGLDVPVAENLGLEQRKRERLIQLRRILAIYFNKEELRTLCFDLGVNYDDLGGEGNADKARELVAHFDRQGSVDELERKIEQYRPGTISFGGDTGEVLPQLSLTQGSFPVWPIQTRIGPILYKLMLCTFLSLVILAVVAGCIQIVLGQVLDTTLRVGLFLFWVPMFFVIFEWLGLHQDIGSLMQQLLHKTGKR